MATKPRYFKLGKLSSIFTDPATKMKVTKNVPAMLETTVTKRITEALSNGHIVEIQKDEYDTAMAAHDVNIGNQHAIAKVNKEFATGKATASDVAQAKSKAKSEALTSEKSGEEDDDPDGDELTRKDMIQEIKDNPNIPAELKPSKNKFKEMTDEQVDALHTELMEKYPAE